MLGSSVFFRNSICFRCLLFGVEILRLVYKKKHFLNIERFLSYLTFYPLKKVAPPLMRVEKKFFKIGVQGIKRSGIWQNGKKRSQKNWIFRDLENFAKTCFYEKKVLGTSWRKSSTHFWNQRKILLLLIPFVPNFEDIFSTLLLWKLNGQIR